jgi:hypothetical protein
MQRSDMGAESCNLPVTYHKVIHIMFPAKTSVLQIAPIHEGRVRVRCSESDVVVVSEKTAELENLVKTASSTVFRPIIEYKVDFV